MKLRRPTTLRLLPAAVAAACLVMVAGCTIEPPLHLATTSDGQVMLGEIITNLDVVWDIDTDWRTRWWYGWDDEDIVRWGNIEYPVPTTYQGRFYYYGEDPEADSWSKVESQFITETHFRRQFNYGYHDMLIWSNIDSPDGTQVVIVDERDPANIFATTSQSRLYYTPPQSRVSRAFNNPEIFYSCNLDHFYISRDIADYDYFDPERNAWVKQLHADFQPLVYIYLVQVVIYHNNGLVVGITDNAAISSLADGVNVNTGHTSNNPVTVAYEMGFKHNRAARDGQTADIFGGKLTTFGLCDMERWISARGHNYAGSRNDLTNLLSLCLKFSSATDSVYNYDITPQLRSQAHGGIVTIEIDADTLTVPQSKSSSSMFDPTISNMEQITNEFNI